MDLDNLETGDVFFTSQADPEEDNNTDSETVDLIRRSTPAPHPIFPQDNSQIADLNDTEAGDVASMAQTATGGGHSTGSGAVSLICRSTPPPSDLFSGRQPDHGPRR